MAEIQDVEYPTEVLAGILGVTKARIRQLSKQGMPKAGRNLYPMIACVQWYINFWKTKASTNDAVTERHKRRLSKAKADIAEIEAKSKKGDMVPAAEVEKDGFNLGRQIRDAMTSIPDRISDQLAVETESIKVHEKLLNEIIFALKGLSE